MVSLYSAKHFLSPLPKGRRKREEVEEAFLKINGTKYTETLSRLYYLKSTTYTTCNYIF